MNIEKFRLDKGYTQDFIASKLNMTQSAYSQKECGKRRFKMEELFALEILLGVSVSEMFAEIKNKVENELKNQKRVKVNN